MKEEEKRKEEVDIPRASPSFCSFYFEKSIVSE